MALSHAVSSMTWASKPMNQHHRCLFRRRVFIMANTVNGNEVSSERGKGRATSNVSQKHIDRCEHPQMRRHKSHEKRHQAHGQEIKPCGVERRKKPRVRAPLLHSLREKRRCLVPLNVSNPPMGVYQGIERQIARWQCASAPGVLFLCCVRFDLQFPLSE